jgi:hypothetical protein
MMDLGELPFGRYEFAVWAGGHVTAGQHAGKDVRRGSELEAQDVGKSAFFGFDDGVGAPAKSRTNSLWTCFTVSRLRRIAG